MTYSSVKNHKPKRANRPYIQTVMRIIFLAIALLCGSLSITSAQTVRSVDYYPMLTWDTSPYKSLRYTRENVSWQWINFRLLFPNGYDSLAQDNKKYPIIIMLHGAGESGRMEWNNSTKTNSPYPINDPRRDNNDHHLMFGGREHLNAVQADRFPGFVLFPQNSYGVWVDGKGEATASFHDDLEKAIELLEYLVQHLKIDPSRIYIHGLSAGGKGVWLAAHKRPDIFAAALPMSAPGDPAMAEQLASLPLWVFQGALDTNPRPSNTRKTVDAINKAGGEVRYTEYENVEHNTWTKGFKESDFFEWMLGKSKGIPGTPNKKPVLEADDDKSISLPTNSTTFSATASDPDGTIVSYLWEQIEGPKASLSGTTTNKLSVAELVAGSYIFRVSVRDNSGAMVSVELNLLVNPGSNKVPTVNAGQDKSITLPVNTSNFTATTSDEDGEIESYLWEQVGGPEELAMTGTSSATVSLGNLNEGIYTFKITVTDNAGAKAWDEVQLTVKPSSNKLPNVNAGEDVKITLPENSVTFTANASDADGAIVTYLWEQIGGEAATLNGAQTATLSVSGLKKGTFTFRVTVTDDKGGTAADQLIVAVFDKQDGNQLPLAHAGIDTTLTLPINSLYLVGSAFDGDGSLVSYLWEKVSGPEINMANTDSTHLELFNLNEGVYVFRFTATDAGGAAATDEVTITVAPPIVNGVHPAENPISYISAYPNPFNQYLSLALETPRLEMIEVAVFDMLSKQVFKGSFQSIPGEKVVYSFHFPAGKLEKGTYFVQVGNSTGTIREVLKVIKYE